MGFIKYNTSKYTGLVLQFCLLIFIFSCKHAKKNLSHKDTPDESIERGRILAQTYCQSCHVLPDPLLLDSKNWEKGVLPAMGPRLGIFNDGFTEYPSSKYDQDVDKNFYPALPVLSQEEWKYIKDYYTAVSPDSLPGQQRKYLITISDSLFKVEMPSLKYGLPATCFVKIDTAASPRKVIIADMITKNIFRFNDHLSLLDSIRNTSPVVDLEIHPNEMIACNIGIMSPNNGKHGSVERIVTDGKGQMKIDSNFLFNKLVRPVQMISADLNADGRTDYLICEFGNLTGALSWGENLGDNKFEKHILRSSPGAIKAYVQDINNDGLPDLWVLFAQGDEGIFLFINKGHGKFYQQEVLRFQPIFGSSYFELADFNKDGYPDIVYTCGDNADYSPTLKPYHGVYIFINDGTNHFTQQYFFPINGCFKAMARDFDGDGDLDLATISFFADWAHQPEESFVYLQNNGNLDFRPYSIHGITSGRWLTMDVADLDKDGKTDIILGNFSIAPPSIKSAAIWKDGPPFIILKNIINK